jgi:4-amino-4-deoxy-L-arabinose transferase-like glycosyltransferase
VNKTGRPSPFPTRRGKQVIPLLLLAVAGFLIFFERFHTYSEPLETDLTTYAVVAHGMLQGRDLYSDLWDHKPPGLYAAYALGELFAGYGPRAVFALNLAASLLLLLLFFHAGAIEGFDPRAGLWAALFFAAVSGDPFLQANQPNTELFLNLFLTATFGLWLRLKPDSPRFYRTGGIGLLFALGSFFKPIILISFFFLAMAHLAFSRRNRALLRLAALQVAVMLSVVALAYALLLCYFLVQGRLRDLMWVLVGYNRFYAFEDSVAHHSRYGLSDFFPLCTAVLWPLGIFALGVRGLLSFQRPSPFAWTLWVALALSCLSMVAAPGFYFPHYYQLFFPPVILGAAWAVVDLEQSAFLRSRPWRFLPGLILLGWLAFHEGPFYLRSAEQWSIAKYGGPLFIQTRTWGERLGHLLGPGESFYQWGTATGLYFYSGHDPIPGIFYSAPLCKGPHREDYTLKTLGQLQASPPEVFVVGEPASREDLQFWMETPLRPWMEKNYRPWGGPGAHDGFYFFILKNGRLDRERIFLTAPSPGSKT